MSVEILGKLPDPFLKEDGSSNRPLYCRDVRITNRQQHATHKTIEPHSGARLFYFQALLSIMARSSIYPFSRAVLARISASSVAFISSGR